MNKLLLVIVMSLIGNAIAWLHMNAQFKWEWAKSIWWIVLGGVPISFYFFILLNYHINTLVIIGQ